MEETTMKIRIEIELDNAAFFDAPGAELGRILSNLSRYTNENPDRASLVAALGTNKDPRALFDLNGHMVGTVRTVGRWNAEY
ncbi:hypothetical protein [uncultured Pelagimonas sp.]|uniref:hypothetical protein n=1 Tax=uncultured Pelagimonas sp. TaxID=1618102 RepID=UPI00260AB986|nr:hypothetical protein [uncultured Pelagimonas sp.]